MADYDHDGDMDILENLGGMSLPNEELAITLRSAQQPALYVGSPPSPPDTAVIHLVGTLSNRDAVGAKIAVGEPPQRFYSLHGTQGFQSLNSSWLPVYLGGPSAMATITWPSGKTTQRLLMRGSRVEIVEPR